MPRTYTKKTPEEKAAAKAARLAAKAPRVNGEDTAAPEAEQQTLKIAPGAVLPGPPPAPVVVPPVAPLSELERIVDMAIQKQVVRGDREEAILCALKGQELGIPTLRSLEGLYLREGKFCMTAGLMRDRILRSGAGEIAPVVMTDEKVVLEVVRYGVKGRPDRAMTFTYDREKAVKHGKQTNEFFMKYPGATMLAWQTGEAARAFFEDILGGASYTPEEITIQGKAPARQATKAPAVPQEARKAAPPTQGTPQAKAEAPSQAPAPEAKVLPELTHEFQVMQAGAVVVKRTAGLTLTQLQEIGNLCSVHGGIPGHEDRAKKLTELIAEAGLPELKYANAVQMEAMLAQIRPNGAKLVGKTGKTRAQVLDEVCAQGGVSQHRALVEQVILTHLKMANLDAAGEREFQVVLDEMKQLMRDPVSFGVIMERSLAEVPS